MLIKSKYHISCKAVALGVACLFLSESVPLTRDAYALGVPAGTQNPDVRKEARILEWVLDGRLEFTKTAEDEAFLKELNHADAILLAHGKILAAKELKEDPLKLIRVVIHEQVEALMQIMARDDYARYAHMRDIVLGASDARKEYYKLLPGGTLPHALTDDLRANDILAKAFELLIPKRERLMDEGEMTPDEAAFLAAIEPVINAYGHTYFTGVFWNDVVRSSRIRMATANGMRFHQVASTSEPSDTGDLPGEIDVLDERSDLTSEDIRRAASVRQPPEAGKNFRNYVLHPITDTSDLSSEIYVLDETSDWASEDILEKALDDGLHKHFIDMVCARAMEMGFNSRGSISEKCDILYAALHEAWATERWDMDFRCCCEASFIAAKLFGSADYTVRIQNISEPYFFNHYYVEIFDKKTGILYRFDPTVEQFLGNSILGESAADAIKRTNEYWTGVPSFAARHEEFEQLAGNIVTKEIGTPYGFLNRDTPDRLDGQQIKARIVHADLGRDARDKAEARIGGYHFYSQKYACTIIVLNTRNIVPFQREAEFVEARKIYWESASWADGIRLTEEEAAILASAEDIVQFGQGDIGLTPYDNLMLGLYTQDELRGVAEKNLARRHAVLYRAERELTKLFYHSKLHLFDIIAEYDAGVKKIASVLATRPAVDPRPIEYGMLGLSYVGHDMEVKRAVNPRDDARTVVYAASGVDLLNLLLSTNATKGYLLDRAEIDFDTVKECIDGDWAALTPSRELVEKFIEGFQSSAEEISHPEKRLVMELAALGVKKEDVTYVGLDQGNVRIRFWWAYAGDAKKEREMTFVTVRDIADTGTYPAYVNDVLKNGIDIYYQRAALDLSRSYTAFIGKFAESVRPGGVLVTDDYTYQTGRKSTPADLGLVLENAFPGVFSDGKDAALDEYTKMILSLRDPDCFLDYGWHVTLRWKTGISSASAATFSVFDARQFKPCAACQAKFDATGERCDGMITGTCATCAAHKMFLALKNPRTEDPAAAFRASLKSLAAESPEDFMRAASGLFKVAGEYQTAGESLVLYADDILEKVSAADLENTLKHIFTKQNILSGGTIVLYAKNPAYARILENIIRSADPQLKTMIITAEELRKDGTEVDELQSILDKAKNQMKAKGATKPEFLGVIRGPTKEPEALAGLAQDMKLPIVIVGIEDGTYSFADALAAAIQAKKDERAKKNWLISIYVIKASKDIEEKYKEHKRSLAALVAA